MAKTLTSGLYDPAFEKDSCGFGLIANIDNEESHFVVETAIAALARLPIAVPSRPMARLAMAAGC